VLLPGEIDTVHVHFSSTIPGAHSAMLYYTYGGTKPGTVTFGLAADVVAAAPNVLLSDTGFDFGAQSLCSNDTTVELTITNAACDSVLVVTTGGNAGPFSLPAHLDTVLAPQAVLHLSFLDHPSQDGDFAQALTLRLSRTDGSLASDTVISFHAIVGGVTDTLYSPLSAIEMGTTYTCIERDTFVTLYNPGCDTVCVSGVTIAPADFILTSASQFCIPPGAWDTLSIESQIDTTAHKAINQATLQISSSTSSPIPPIALSREINYPATWGFHLSSPDSATPGNTVTFIASQMGTLPADVTALDFTLTYKDDLLGFVNANEASITPAASERTSDGMAHQSFHLASIPTDTTLATLHFFTYLTPASQTMVALDTLTFESSFGRPSACIATIDTTRSAFLLLPECGSLELTSVLASGHLAIDNITPNPAEETIAVAIDAGASGEATLSIVDAVGRTRVKQTIAVPSTKLYALPLSIADFPNGMYTVQLFANGFYSSKQFIKQ
jgi:hypothetical protein